MMTPPVEPADPPPAATRRWPIFSTIVVAAAVAVMIALGIWQIQREKEKTALLAIYAANLDHPAAAFPAIGPVPPEFLFRRSSAICLEVVGWRVVGGNARSGISGFRHLADCRTGAEGPGFVADMGVTQAAQFHSDWRGGPVSGIITEEPVVGGLWAKLTGTAVVPRPMLVADVSAPGLQPSAPPDVANIPNNHLAYAVQWFLFALIAAVVFVLAVRKWQRGG